MNRFNVPDPPSVDLIIARKANLLDEDDISGWEQDDS